MFDWDRHEVCLAEGPRDSYVLLALRPEQRGDTVVWDDGSHQRAFAVERVLTDEPDRFRFEDERGRTFTLRPLTARLYAERVREQVGGPTLATDEKVRAFYLAPRGVVSSVSFGASQL